MKLVAKALSAIFYAEIAVMVILALACFAGLPFGIKNFAVTTASMTPTIPVGSMVYVNTNIPGDAIRSGDCVAFYVDETNSNACVHRAIATDEVNKTIRTKGDANSAEDLAPVAFSDVVGRMDFTAPYLGYLCDAVASKGIFIALVILATALLSQLFARLSQNESPNSLQVEKGI